MAWALLMALAATTPRVAAAKELLARHEARRSLLAYTEYTHPKWETSKHHVQICEHLEAVERGEIKRLMIFAPPRHGKSELASRRFPAWYMGRNPSRQIICASHTADLANDFGAEVRDIVQDPWARNIFSKLQLNPDAKAAKRWRTTEGGIYVAAGVDGTITGRGAHVAVIDDPIKGRNDAESPRMRELAWRWYLGDLYQRLMPDGAIVLMTTRWHEDDLAGRILTHLGDSWTILKLEAIANEGTDHEEALWPGWWPLEELREKRDMYRKAGRLIDWTAQYQQRPTAEEGTEYKRDWFSERYDTQPDNLRVYIASDYAVTKATGSNDPDYTEHGVFGLAPDDRLYVLDWWSGRTTSDVWIETLLDLVERWKPSGVYGEKGVIKNSIEPLLERRKRERRVYFRQEWLPTSSDKLARGRPFQAWAASRRIVFPRVSTWAEEVIDQVVSVPGNRYWDKFDVMAHMIAAIDQTHPNKERKKRSDHTRDKWESSGGRAGVQGWRVA